MLKTRGLKKVYNHDDRPLEVLKGVDMEAVKGEFISVLGASGAGKSTLLHLLGGLDEPSSGKVYYKDVDIYRMRDNERALLRNRKFGFVFQFYHLLPEFTALENVMLPGLIAGSQSGHVREKARGLLEIVGLEKRLSHRPSQLSGGEQQRVAIARALVNEPEVLICDEPTGNLDSSTGEKIIELIRRLNQEKGYLVIVATHSRELADISSRIIHIKDGKIIRGGENGA